MCVCVYVCVYVYIYTHIQRVRMREGERGWEDMEGGGRNKTKERRKISLAQCLKMINSDCLQGRDTGKGV